MLDSLHIENIAVIEKTDVEFSQGFTVLTGETGAGKSIIIDSINAVLGERTSKELIRTGCDNASVTAVFSCIPSIVFEKLKSYGIDDDNDTLIITRKITETKSSCKINGQNTPAFVLKEIAPYLIDIHGQHDSQMLLNPDMHYIYIDLLAKNGDILEDYRQAFSTMLKTRKSVKKHEQEKEQTERRKEILQYQINELETFGVAIGEIDELKQKRDEFLNAKKIADALITASRCLGGDNDEIQGSYNLFSIAADEILKIAEFSESLSETADKVDSLRYEIEDIKQTVEDYLENFEVDEKEFETLENRLDTYNSFRIKYGENEQEMLAFLKNAKDELENLEELGENAIAEQELLPKQIEEVKEKGKVLSESRKKAAKYFASNTCEQLKYLDMPDVKIEVSIEKCPYSSLGADKVEFLISTNPGEPLKPLSKIASGGEMSRIMLSIKNVLSNADIVPTLIFDEIDTGISGSAAAKVAYKLKTVSKGKQVICVTHLAQIAAKANTHLKIEKLISSGRASTNVRPLDFEGRKRELARIIGSAITPASLATAEEMLNN